MRLSKIKIKNYRLLIDAELEVDSKTTLIVGRNNTAKTSCFECIGKVLDGTPFLSMITRCQKEKIYMLILLRSWQRKLLLKIYVNGWNQYL